MLSGINTHTHIHTHDVWAAGSGTFRTSRAEGRDGPRWPWTLECESAGGGHCLASSLQGRQENREQ